MAIPVNAAASAATAGTATDSVRIRLILPRKTSVSLRCRNGLPSGAATPRNAHGRPQPCFISQITTTSQTATWRPVSTRVAAATGRKPWPYPLSRPGRYSRPHRTPQRSSLRRGGPYRSPTRRATWAQVDRRGSRVPQVVGSPGAQGHGSRAGFRPSENKASRRSVPLSKTVVALLHAHRTRQNEERLRLGDLPLTRSRPRILQPRWQAT